MVPAHNIEVCKFVRRSQTCARREEDGCAGRVAIPPEVSAEVTIAPGAPACSQSTDQCSRREAPHLVRVEDDEV